MVDILNVVDIIKTERGTIIAEANDEINVLFT